MSGSFLALKSSTTPTIAMMTHSLTVWLLPRCC